MPRPPKPSSFQEFTHAVDSRLQQEPGWSLGQAFFNTLYELDPELADHIRGTDLDPFDFRDPETFVPAPPPEWERVVHFIANYYGYYGYGR